jgi:hypothetical protein
MEFRRGTVIPLSFGFVIWLCHLALSFGDVPREHPVKSGFPRLRSGVGLIQLEGSLLRGDDAAYGHAGGEGFFLPWAFEVHGLGGHVGVFEAGASVEEDDFVGGL